MALVKRCLAGDRLAWDELVRSYSPLVYSIATRSGLGADDRDDVFQSTFAAVVKNLGSLRDGQALTKWIITTATRESWRCARRRGMSALGEEPAMVTRDRIEELERAQVVDAGLKELGGQCEKLLRALFATQNEPDYRAVAELLGIAVGSIGPTRQRCLAKLAELVRDRIE